MKKFFLRLLLILLTIPIVLAGIIFYHLNSLSTEKLDIEKLHVSKNEILSDTINIALFGTDNRKANSNSRSDSVIIATINLKSKKIKLTSIMRDTFVDIPGRGFDKLTHAHAYGGPELAISTLNRNFDLNITDYASVDFFSVAKIIDALGGFEVTLKGGEAAAMNKAINEINRIEKLPIGTDYVYNSDEPQVLNGRQAVSYARIRKTGNGDYERTERQRRVLSYCINKLQDLSLPASLNLISELVSSVNTSLLPSEIINLATQVLKLGKFEVEQLRLPVDGTFTTTRHNNMWVIKPDFEANTRTLHDFISDNSSDN